MTITEQPNGTTPYGDELSEMRSLVQRIDQLLATPGLMAAVDGAGNPGAVAAGELIESAWGNSVKDRVVRKYSGDAQLSADAAPNGTHGWSPDNGGWTFVRRANSWRRNVGSASAIAQVSAPTTGGNASMTLLGGAINIATQDAWGIRPLVDGVYLIGATLLFAGAAQGVNNVVSARIDIYDAANAGTPKASAEFMGGKPSYWQPLTHLAVFAMSPGPGDYVRVMLGGDVSGVTLDARSRLYLSRIGPIA